MKLPGITRWHWADAGDKHARAVRIIIPALAVAGLAMLGSPTPRPVPSAPHCSGCPILVIGSAGNPFSQYYAEILRAEGLNAFDVVDVADVNAATLSARDVAILAEVPLSEPQAATLADWVRGGGQLIAMRPDVRLRGLFGLTERSGTLSDGYLRIETGAAPGRGLVGETIQFHGTADYYEVNAAQPSAVALATLFSSPAKQTPYPAVTLRSVGRGKAAALAFDLARSIVYTRQGNPAWAGQKRDRNIPPTRSDDLFYGAKPGDEQPDWVNLDKVAIPQADELQRLLANLILDMNRDRRPLPRFWYFPFGKKAVVVMTSDNHGNRGQIESRLDRQLSQDPPGCDPARWECVRSTVYMYPSQPLSKGTYYQGRGFEFGVHLNVDCADWTPIALAFHYRSQLAEFIRGPQFAGLAAPVTNRTDCIVWSDWATQPRVQRGRGIRLDTSYYYWPPEWVKDRPGFFTGSGMPMRFADADGSVIDVYQAATQITDESKQKQPFTIDTLLDRALGPEGYYGAITANIHCDSGDNSLSDAIVGSAQARGVPVISARQMLTWLDGRNGSSFQAIHWSEGVLTFGIAVGSGAAGLQAMLPTHAGKSRILTAITRGGVPTTYRTENVKGVEYSVFEAAPGLYRASYPAALPAL